MLDTNLINEPTAEILAARARWKKNREILAGEAAVKANARDYLPAYAGQTGDDYKAFVQRTDFFPAAARTRDGLKGLVTRKAPFFECPDGLKDMFDTITKAGHTAQDLGEFIFDETLETAFPGMLADFPTPPPAEPGSVATIGQLEGSNTRPFVSCYVAEAILEVRTGVYANVQKLDRVRLLDDENTVRELLLVNGAYQIVIHRRDEQSGQWIADAPVTPLRGNKPLDFIPFVLSTPKARSFKPRKGPLDDLCDLNVHLFVASGAAGMSRFFSSTPMTYLLGAEADKMVFSPGALLNFPFHSKEHPVEIGYLEFGGQGQAALDEHETRLLDKMAKLGSSILASESNKAEAAETHAIRRSSENSVLASIARSVSRAVEEILDICAWWQGQERGSVKFALNTDFVPQPMSAEERKAALTEWQTGAISYETYIAQLIAGEVLPDDFDVEEEQQRLANDAATIDRPIETQEPPVA